jgi:subtilisin family serine protease
MHKSRFLLLPIAFLLFFSLSLQAGPPVKINRSTSSAQLINVASKIEQHSSPKKTGHLLSFYLRDTLQTNKQVFRQSQTGVKTIQVLVQSQNPLQLLSPIQGMGAYVQAITERVMVVEATPEVIKSMAELEGVQRIQASLPLKTLLNESRPESGVDQIHIGVGLDTTYEGEDVVVGIVDSGIDEDHPDFNTPDGSRILYLWDMSGSGSPPSAYNYGSEYTKADIDAGNCLQTDEADGGHGTHVAGIAAGNGRSKSGYIGMAPKADIIFVKGFRFGPYFTNSDVINACDYIFQKAAALGKKAVINLSLGGHFGPHDGTSSFETGLEDLTGKGNIIVAAAGNEGNSLIHVRYATGGTDYNSARETLFELSPTTDQCVIDMWYPSSGNIKVGIAAFSKSTGNLIARLDVPIGPGGTIDELFSVSGTTYARFTIDASNQQDIYNGDRQVTMVVSSEGGAYPASTVYWSLYTWGTGTLDAWINGAEFLDATGFLIENPDSERTIALPATSNEVLAVGSYVTKKSWTDLDGTSWSISSATVNEISDFSSIGPTRDGRQKPEISAPGQVIASALSGDVGIGTDILRRLVLSGSELVINQGTSMSAPHVAGTIALMLQKNPQATYDTVLTAFKNTAISDAQTGSVPNDTWGYGKMDAYEAFKLLGETEPDPVLPSTSVLKDNLLVSSNTNSVVISYAIPASETKLSLDLDIFDVLGRRVRSYTIQSNEIQLVVDLSDLASGMYFYRVKGYDDMKRLLIIR